MVSNKPEGGQVLTIDSQQMRLWRMKKGVMTASRLVNDRLRDAPIRWASVMVTLTYKGADDWRPEHISDFLRRVQAWARRKGQTLPYVWVAELQQRGALHYHVILWMPARWRIPAADRRGWWPHGASNTVRAKSSVGYLVKYASKLESKGQEFPKGARIHGIGGLTKQEKRVVAWWKLPKDLRTGEEGSVSFRRAVGGGWENRDTGDRILPAWEMVGRVVDGKVRIKPDTRSSELKTWASYWREENAGAVKAMRKATGIKVGARVVDYARVVESMEVAQWWEKVGRHNWIKQQRANGSPSYWNFWGLVERGVLPVRVAPTDFHGPLQ